MLLGTIRVVVGIRGHLAVGLDGFFCHLELHGLLSAGLADGGGYALDGLRRGGRHRQDGSGLALGLVDGGLFFALGSGNEGLALAGWRC